MAQWWQIVLTIVCIFLSGTFSGLTLGLMSLDLIDLRVISASGTDKEKWFALRILPIRRHGNWLLCTLLIGNTAVNAALAIFTADLFGGIVGFLTSTFTILYMGEIIPQAVCHRFGLIVGAYAVPFIRILMYLTAPLSFTTAKALDFFLGGEPVTRYNRSQLKSLLSMHGIDQSEGDLTLPSRSNSFGGGLSPTTDPQDPPNSSPGNNQTVIELHPDKKPTSDTPIDTETKTETTVPTNPTSTETTSPFPQHPSVASSQQSSPSKSPSSMPPRNRFNPFSRIYALARGRKAQNASSTKRKDKDENNSHESDPLLTKDEMAILGGAFDFSQKKVGQVMTALNDAFMLDASVSLNFKILLLVFQSGHSRIPIYSGSRENIIGLLFVKDLILLDPEDCVPIKTVLSFFKRTVFSVMQDTPLNKMLNIFCQGGGHMAIVRSEKQQGTSSSPQTLGIVTLEDLIEELIGQDIVDETDVYTDNLNKQRVKRVRSIDPNVLRMFDSTHDEEILSEKEVSVIASYLANNAHEFSEEVIKLDVLRNMLAEIPIMECHHSDQPRLQIDKDSQIGQLSLNSDLQSNDPLPDALLEGLEEAKNNGNVSMSDLEISDDAPIYSKGVPTKNSYLIIHGKIQIIAGDDEFVSEAGPWTLLGVRALTQDLYAPDFTARVIERPTRVLRISRKLYRLMLHASNTTNGENIQGAPSLAMKEVRMARHKSMTGTARSRRESSASRSSPSLAMAAAEAAMAIGNPAGERGD